MHHGSTMTRISPQFSEDFIRDTGNALSALRSFLNRNMFRFFPHLREGQGISDMMSSMASMSAQEQQRELVGLYHLCSRCLEVLTFIDVLKQYNLAALLKPEWVPEDRHRRLLQFKFKDFAVQEEGGSMMKDLVRLIVTRGSL